MSKLSWWKTACAVALLCAGTAIVSPAQTFKTLVSFDGADGANPDLTSPAQGTDGNLYGATEIGGENGLGTVFKVTPAGALTTLHSFAGSDGAYPQAGLALGTNGIFYGTTSQGGANNDGTVFSITSGGTLTTLHSFAGSDGASPEAALVQATDGALYGTTGGAGPMTTAPSLASRQAAR